MIGMQKPIGTSQTKTFSSNDLSYQVYPFQFFTKDSTYYIICTSLQIVSFFIFPSFFAGLYFPLVFFASSKIALVTTRRVFHFLGNNGKFFTITISTKKIILFTEDRCMIRKLPANNYAPNPNFQLRPKHICLPHGLQTSRESFFQKSRTFGHGRTFWAEFL